MPETTCPMCGRPAKIVGRTTLHYEPLEAGPASPISFTTGDITTRDTTGQMTVSIPFRGFVSSDADEAGRAILTESVRVHAAVDVS
jgi:hypothetical protein